MRANDISVFPSNLAALQAILKQFYTSPECRKWLESGKDRKRSTTERHGKSERGWGRNGVQEAPEQRRWTIYRKARVGETDNTPSRWVAYLRVHGVAPGVQ